MRESMQNMFETLLAGEPPMGLTVAQVRHRGRQRLYRRRAVVAAGSVVAVGVAGGAAAMYAPTGQRQVGAGPWGATVATQTTPAATPSKAPAIELPRCNGDGSSLRLADTDGSVLPDPGIAAQRVLAAAPSFAPGRTFRLVTAELLNNSGKSARRPRAYLIFDVKSDHGVGSVNLEFVPQAGAGAHDRAIAVLAQRPFANCTEPARTDYPDGAVGLSYVAAGTGRAYDTVQRTYYFSPRGLDISVGMFMTAWEKRAEPGKIALTQPGLAIASASASTSSDARSPQPPVATIGDGDGDPSMPLSSAEVLALVRIVATI